MWRVRKVEGRRCLGGDLWLLRVLLVFVAMIGVARCVRVCARVCWCVCVCVWVLCVHLWVCEVFVYVCQVCVSVRLTFNAPSQGTR